MGRGKIRGDATVHVAVVMHERAVIARVRRDLLLRMRAPIRTWTATRSTLLFSVAYSRVTRVSYRVASHRVLHRVALTTTSFIRKEVTLFWEDLWRKWKNRIIETGARRERKGNKIEWSEREIGASKERAERWKSERETEERNRETRQ